ncbi:MAG: hypothetical protein FWG90_03625 [Oscillospiraceae bacterium]|nr:hypothetical protein [Oscillospiraceae bacterium]
MKSDYFEKVEPRFLEIGEWVRAGLTQVKMAENLGVSYTTFKNYKKKHPALSALLKKNTRTRNAVAEDALYSRATGLFAKTEKPIKVKHTEYDPKTGKKVKEFETVEITEVKEYIPPDTAALIFFLTNRMGEKYKNNPHKLELDGRKVKLIEKKAEEDDNWREEAENV